MALAAIQIMLLFHPRMARFTLTGKKAKQLINLSCYADELVIGFLKVVYPLATFTCFQRRLS